MKWKSESILNGLKFISLKFEHMIFIGSASYLPMPLRKLSEVFGLSVTKSWYPHFFNNKTNLEYVGPFPDISYFGANVMSQSERREFMMWYERQKNKVFDNRRILEQYYKDEVTVLRQACQIFSRDFIEIGSIYNSIRM